MKTPEQLNLAMLQTATQYQNAKQKVRELRDAYFKPDSVVFVERIHQYGIVRDVEDCWPDHVAVLVQSGNTWYYRLDEIMEYDVPRANWPSWVVTLKRRQAARKGAFNRRERERREAEMEMR